MLTDLIDEIPALYVLSRAVLPNKPKAKKDGRTALYRHFSADGDLLYVGISLNVLSRLEAHRNGAIWFYDIARIEVEWFPSRIKAEYAEHEAIKADRPLFNKRK